MAFSKNNIKGIVDLMGDLYDEAYNAYDRVDWYNRGMFVWDVLFATESPLIGEVARARHDVMSSDRECAAFGEAVARLCVGL